MAPTSFTAGAAAIAVSGLHLLTSVNADSLWSGNILPLTIGHRGLLSKYPENTLISYQAALEVRMRELRSSTCLRISRPAAHAAEASAGWIDGDVDRRSPPQ